MSTKPKGQIRLEIAQVLFIKDRNLKAKLYHEETLSLTKVLEIGTQYRDKEVLFLVPEGQENNIRTD